MEPKARRLRRLRSGPPIEAIETLLNSINNFLNNEISLTIKHHQTSLLFLGIHAAALTISEALFGKSGKEGYRTFLEKFVDGQSKDRKFSKIAHVLHDWRNILAHQWISSRGHKIEYDYKISKGWRQNKDRVVINPKIYCECYLQAFSKDGKIWQYQSFLSPQELKKAKQRIIEKYEEY